MRKMLLFFVVLPFLGFGCTAFQPTIAPIEKSPVLTELDSMRTFRLNEFQFTLPTKWKFSKIADGKAYILTDYKPYTVYLTLEIALTEQLLSPDDLAISEKERSLKLPEGLLYETGGNGVEASYFVADHNNRIYSIFWDVESNQPAPKNLDGIWGPDHNVTRDEIWNMMTSLRVISK